VNKEFETPVRDRVPYYVKSRVKELMDERGLSINEVARKSGLKYDTVKSYYDDNVQKPDSYTRAVLCATLDCELSDLEELVFHEEFLPNKKSTEKVQIKYETSTEKV